MRAYINHYLFIFRWFLIGKYHCDSARNPTSRKVYVFMNKLLWCSISISVCIAIVELYKFFSKEWLVESLVEVSIIIFIGIFVSCSSYFTAETKLEDKNDDSVKSTKDVIKIVLRQGLNGAMFSSLTYAGLNAYTQLDYILIVIFSAGAAFFGPDKLIEYYHKIRSAAKWSTTGFTEI